MFDYNKNTLRNKCSHKNRYNRRKVEKHMKNLKIVNMKKFIRSISILLFVVVAIIFLSTKVSLSHNEYPQLNYDTVTVIKGDTLWQISVEQQKNNPYYTNKDVRNIINHIKKVNNLKTSDLTIGQELKIPVI